MRVAVWLVPVTPACDMFAKRRHGTLISRAAPARASVEQPARAVLPSAWAVGHGGAERGEAGGGRGRWWWREGWRWPRPAVGGQAVARREQPHGARGGQVGGADGCAPAGSRAPATPPHSIGTLAR